MDTKDRITYKQGMSSKELGGYIRAIAIPIAVFFLAAIISYQFGAFGKNIIAPATSLMCAAGAAAAWKIPSQRKETLKHTYTMIAGYVCGLFLLKLIIGWAANTSSEQLMASYSQTMPISTGSTIAGYLQSMLWILAFMTPITFLTMMGKKLVMFRRTLAKNKVLEHIRDIREN